MEYVIMVLFYFFGEIFMYLKTMKDLGDVKVMPEFFIYGAAFFIIFYPITYPIDKLIEVLESRKHYKKISLETARL